MHRIWQFRECWRPHSLPSETRPTPARAVLLPPAPKVPGDASDRNSGDNPRGPPREIPAFHGQPQAPPQNQLPHYLAGAGCGAVFGAEKFTFGTSREPSAAAKYALFGLNPAHRAKMLFGNCGTEVL